MLLLIVIITAALPSFVLGVWHGRRAMDAAILKACKQTRDLVYDEIVTIAIAANQRYRAQMRAGVAEGLRVGREMVEGEALS